MVAKTPKKSKPKQSSRQEKPTSKKNSPAKTTLLEFPVKVSTLLNQLPKNLSDENHLPKVTRELEPGILTIGLHTQNPEKVDQELFKSFSKQVRLVDLGALPVQSSIAEKETQQYMRRHIEFYYVGYPQKGCVKLSKGEDGGTRFMPTELYASSAQDKTLKKYEQFLANMSPGSYTFHSLAMRILKGEKMMLGDWRPANISHSAVVKNHLINRVIETIKKQKTEYPWK